MSEDPWMNIPLTATEALTMESRPKQPKYARNKNIVVIGGSGSGKTRFFVKPSVMQMNCSMVIRVVVEDMLVLVKHFTKKYPQKQFRILEIGAGVGGVSIDLIEALKIYNVEYLFTDISRSFLNEAQERFKKYPWVKFGLYDINIDYWKQDIPTSYFDVILCNNVLHNANNEVKVLQCNDMEEYLSVKPEKLIQFLGEKYAKILIDTEKEVYDLVGYCMGGLIALETAKILTEAGKTVHSLISVDTTPSRRMVNNELLMERAFGMIIGADTYKVGHTVEDELLKRAIKELGEKYGDNVSNEELVSLEGEFLPVSQCYGKLIKKTHAERLLELYNTLPATKGETSGYSKERLDTLYKVFCHSFSAVIMYDAGIYVGNALVLSCRNKNSSFLPVEPTDNERFWKEATVGNITSELIEGEHLTCMTGSYADKVAERILKEERL